MINFQTMAIIFIIVFLPVTMLLQFYIDTQIDTIALQTSYDTKLLNATYDAIVAFQLNSINNSGYSSNADPLRRDINASINTFLTSLANNFGTTGYGKNEMLPYIPAIVYTLYDGYYIYSPMAINDEKNPEKTVYKHTLKPYIYYTARYTSGANTDFIVNYSLDNYIVVYGNINGTYYSKAGYLINKKKYEDNNISLSDTDAFKYYQEATDYTDWVNSSIGNLSLKRIDDGRNEVLSQNPFKINENNDPDDKTSAFCEHKSNVIKTSITNNLNSAIANYSAQSEALGTDVNFKLPILSETEWDKMLSNVSIITFMQGLKVGLTTYNNYMIVTSTGNMQYVEPESLYFVVTGATEDDSDKYYHRINCPHLAEDVSKGQTIEGYKSIDFKGIYSTITKADGTKESRYMYKGEDEGNTTFSKHYACYDCIVSSKVGGVIYDNKYKEIDSNHRTFTNNDNNNLITFGKEDVSFYSGISSLYNTDVVNKLRNAYYNALFKERNNLTKVSSYVNGAVN